MTRRRLILLGSVGVVIVGAITAGIVLRKQSPVAVAPPPDEVVRHTTDTPDETKPDPTTYHWQGQSDDPKSIRMSSIGVDGFLQKVGVDQHKQIAAPNNIHLAGWYVDSVRPGQHGLSIIDGHVDGRTGDGIFVRLHELKQGDSIEVTLGNGTVLRYSVEAVQEVALAEAQSVLFSQSSKTASQVNLITCSGAFDTIARTYDKRVIVTAGLQ